MRKLLVLCLLACLARAERIVLRVTADQEPVEGAGIVILKAEAPVVFDRDAFEPKLLTDKAGSAVVELAKDGRVLIYRVGFAVAVVSPEESPADVKLRPERIFDGTLVDKRDKPVVNAAVVLETTFRTPARFLARTDEKGRFFVYGLWLDDSVVRVTAPGFRPFSSFVQSSLKLRGTMQRSASLAGKVLDRRGKPLAKVSVHLATARESTRSVTAKDGSFSFPDLAPGTHALSVDPPYGLEQRKISLKDGEQRKDLEITPLLPATLTLRAIDEQSQPLRGVVAFQSGEPALRAPTDAKGEVSIRVVPRRSGLILLVDKRFAIGEVNHGATPPHSTRSLGDVVLRPIPQVTLVVRRPDGKPAMGRLESIDRQGNAKTDLKEGRAKVEAGLYRLSVDGFAPQIKQVHPPGPVVVTLPEPIWLDGIVRGEQNEPLADALVRVANREFKTDAKGLFRAGPFDVREVEVSARKGRLVHPAIHVVISEGRLELTLSAAKREFVKGRVLRGGQPVERFSVDFKEQLDEEGRFEVLVDRRRQHGVSIMVDRIIRFVPLPPPGRELVVHLPEGTLTVELAGGGVGHRVELRTAAGGLVTHLGADANGVARFTGLATGIYYADAVGYERTEVRVGGSVMLRRLATGTLGILLPAGFRPRPAPLKLEPGLHWKVFAANDGITSVVIERVVVQGAVERVVDLRGTAPLTLEGRGRAWVQVSRTERDLIVDYQTQLDGEGKRRLRLPAGRYTVRSGLAIHHAEVSESRPARVRLDAGAHEFTGQVLLADGRPAQGASIRAYPAGDRLVEAAATTDLSGRFRLASLAAGAYEIEATYRGHAVGRAEMVIDPDGRRRERGLPIRLTKSVGARLGFVGLLGEPLTSLLVRVDGHWTMTDTYGFLTLQRMPATVDLDLGGYASIRRRVVRKPGTLRLQRGADLLVRFDPSKGPVELWIGGRVWGGPLEATWAPIRPGERTWTDLPPGPIEVRQTPQGDNPEPDIVQTKLGPGERLTVNLRAR